MRFLFIFLLALNIGFFAWEFYQRGGLGERELSSDALPATDTGVPPLVLLSERDTSVAAAEPVITPDASEPVPMREETSPPEQAPEQISAAGAESALTPEPAPASPPPTARHCLELGPGADRTVMERAEAEAKQAGMRTTIVETERSDPAGYWVRLPGYFSLAEVRAKYRELQGKGLDDIAMTPQPGKGYVLSLGVYKQKATMEERRAEILAKGVRPVIEDRVKTRKLYTLALEYEAVDQALQQTLQLRLATQVPQFPLQEVECR